MGEYRPATYGDRIADVYDERVARLFEAEAIEPVVGMLAELAAGGRALELGIGTGRIALPLAATGVEVHGIDASEAMIARLRAKQGGADIPVTIGDFADVGVEGRFALVFVVFNTFFGLLTQEDQVRCFRNVAQHLTDGGAFVLEAFVPDLTRFVRGQNIAALGVEVGRVELDVSRHDPVNQRVTAQHVYISEEGVRMYPVQIRYAWPTELDLMAQLGAMRLRERWADWQGTPFGAASTHHVSVYEKPMK